jgi:hypothetical protein
MSGNYVAVPGTDSSSISRRPSLGGSRRRNRLLFILFPLTLLVLVALYTSSKRDLPAWVPLKGSSSTSSTSGRYEPGRVGKLLLSGHRRTLGSSATEDWESLLSSSDEMAGEMFDLMAGRDEEACSGWDGKSELPGCWRARMLEQINSWDYKDAE